MNELIVAQNNLPTTIEDLSAFVLFNDEKVKAVRAALSAMHKFKAPREVLDLKLREAQELSEQVTLAKMELGKRISEIPKAHDGGWSKRNNLEIDTTVESEIVKPKSETIAELGLTQKQAERFQQMAQNPDAVQAAMTKAREAGDVVSQAQILSEIQQRKIPIQQNTGNNERYTPKEYIDAAREVLGTIDLDPASSELANETVKATKIYTAEDDGLAHDWFGNIWLNPPYAKDLLPKFAEKFASSNFNQAIVLVHNATETRWFLNFISKASAVVFPTGRVDCKTPGENRNTPLQGSAIIYSGGNVERFLEVFSKFGWRARL